MQQYSDMQHDDREVVYEPPNYQRLMKAAQDTILRPFLIGLSGALGVSCGTRSIFMAFFLRLSQGYALFDWLRRKDLSVLLPSFVRRLS